MNSFVGLEDPENDIETKFVPIRNHTTCDDSKNFINLEENPEFGLTFGRPDPQLINQLFDTPPVKIHAQKNILKKPPKKPINQPSSALKTRAQSAIHNKILSKELDLEKLRQNMSRITYSIKTIECRNDEEIGISSRRVIMANKLLETQKNLLTTKHNTERSRCTYYSNQASITDENQTQESRFESEKPSKVNTIVHHNKFHSKRLNVIVKKKRSNFPNDLENSMNSFKNFEFDFDQGENRERQQTIESQLRESSVNTIESTSKKTFKSKRPTILENKRLKYETFMAKKSSQKFNSHQGQQNVNPHIKIPFGQKLSQNPFELMSERKKKVSLSNILSQYHTEIIENSNNVLIERSNFCQPLKELFKNKFSTISKTVHDEGKNTLEKNLIKIKMRKHSISKREFGQDGQQKLENGIGAMRKFKKYQEIEKQNACLIDCDNY